MPKKNAYRFVLSCLMTLLAAIFAWLAACDIAAFVHYRQDIALGIFLDRTLIALLCAAPLEYGGFLLTLSFGTKAALLFDGVLALVHTSFAWAFWRCSVPSRKLVLAAASICCAHFLSAGTLIWQFSSPAYWQSTRTLVQLLGTISLIGYGWIFALSAKRGFDADRGGQMK